MSARNGWWNDLFQGLALDGWEQAVPEQQTQTEADFLLRALNAAALPSPLAGAKECRPSPQPLSHAR